MKIVFMGTPKFAATILEALVIEGHEIGFVITNPDRAKDRGKKIQYTEVKEIALKYGIAVLQPEKIKKDEHTINTLKEYAPDMIIVVAYGHILSQEILNIPRLGCINVHGSLLPKWRGAAPIQRCVIAGDEITGVTLMHMADGIDTGDMIAKTTTPTSGKTSDMLFEEMAQMGAELLVKTLPDIEKGTAPREKQNSYLATHAPMLSKAEGEIDFSRSPEEIERLIRGMNSWPGAYTFLQGEVFKVWEAETTDKTTSAASGTIVAVNREGIEVAAGGKILTLKTVQLPGKKKMPVSDYIKGNKIEEGTVLG